MKLEGEGRNFLKKGFSLPLQTSPLPLQRLSYAGVGSGFVLSNGPIGAPSFGWMIQSRYISSQNGQAFSVTCSLLHARNASNGRHAEKPLSAPQARKSCEQGFDNVKNLWGRRGRGLSPERFPPPTIFSMRNPPQRACVSAWFHYSRKVAQNDFTNGLNHGHRSPYRRVPPARQRLPQGKAPCRQQPQAEGAQWSFP